MSLACLCPYPVTNVLYKLQEWGTSWLCRVKHCVSLHNNVGRKWSLFWTLATLAVGPPEGRRRAVNRSTLPRSPDPASSGIIVAIPAPSCPIGALADDGFLICPLSQVLLAQAWETVNFVGCARIASDMTLSLATSEPEVPHLLWRRLPS